jgi:hypothetical protein
MAARDALQLHGSFFDGMLDLVPATTLFGEERVDDGVRWSQYHMNVDAEAGNTSSFHKKRATAKTGKYDPARHRSVTDIQQEKSAYEAKERDAGRAGDVVAPVAPMSVPAPMIGKKRGRDRASAATPASTDPPFEGLVSPAPSSPTSTTPEAPQPPSGTGEALRSRLHARLEECRLARGGLKEGT